MKKCRKCRKMFKPNANQLRKSDYICLDCRKEYDRKWRQKRLSEGLQAYGSNTWDEKKKKKWWKNYYSNPENKKKIAERMRNYRNDPSWKKKNLARWILNRNKKSGNIESEPCTFCGASPTEAHHPDYEKPLLIVWLCKDCHNKIHPRKRESWKYAKAEGRE